jgi:hypothetical protein
MRPSPAPNVALHVERIVVSGVDLSPRQAALVRGAMERELVRLLTRDGLGQRAARGAVLPSVVAPAIQLALPVRPAEAGRQIARSVHESLTKGL